MQYWTDLVQPFKSPGTLAWAQCYHWGSARTDRARTALPSLGHKQGKTAPASKVMGGHADSPSKRGTSASASTHREVQEAYLLHKGHFYPGTVDRNNLSIYVFLSFLDQAYLYISGVLKCLWHVQHQKKIKILLMVVSPCCEETTACLLSLTSQDHLVVGKMKRRLSVFLYCDILGGIIISCVRIHKNSTLFFYMSK